jgi:hypothetical protein
MQATNSGQTVTTDNRQQAADEDNQTDNRTITSNRYEQTTDSRQQTTDSSTADKRAADKQTTGQQTADSNTDSTVSVTSVYSLNAIQHSFEIWVQRWYSFMVQYEYSFNYSFRTKRRLQL